MQRLTDHLNGRHGPRGAFVSVILHPHLTASLPPVDRPSLRFTSHLVHTLLTQLSQLQCSPVPGSSTREHVTPRRSIQGSVQSRGNPESGKTTAGFGGMGLSDTHEGVNSKSAEVPDASGKLAGQYGSPGLRWLSRRVLAGKFRWVKTHI